MVATSTKGTRLLLDGMPAKTEVSHGQVKYFRYFVRTASPIEVVLTPFLYAGDRPDLSRTYARRAMVCAQHTRLVRMMQPTSCIPDLQRW